MLNVGDKAPDFSLPSDSGANVSLKDFKGHTLVLFFFPKADTPGCTSEANQFSDAKNELEKLGARVLGMSGDTVEALQKFKVKYELNCPLAGDTTHKTLEAYDVWQEKNLYGRKSMGIVRTTYIIDGNGTITHAFPKVKVDGHIREILAALKG
jgi:peroxiredoxin Q/BCP